MSARSITARRRLLLVGAGHAHLSVLRAFAREPVEGIDLVLVSPDPDTVYSGMIPGWLAGTYTLEECTIPIAALARRAGAQLVAERLVGLDADLHSVLLSNGGRLSYDLLSLDTGSESDWTAVPPGRCEWMPLRPIAEFARRWQRWEATAPAKDGDLVIVGGGAAGVEVALCINAARLERGSAGTVTLVTRQAHSLGGPTSRAALAADDALREAGVRVLHGTVRPSPDGPVLAEQGLVRVDLAIVATGARSPAWIRASGLAGDDDGFVRVCASHRSTSHPDVFAAGDVCARDDAAWTRSGVHAVHAGPVLAANLRRALLGLPLREYRPRARSLALLATGSGKAIAVWGSLATHAAWAWRWKRWIDERFVRKARAAA